MQKAPKNFLDPKSVIRQMKAKKEDQIAFLGSGSGYFLIPIAKKITNSGKIYAVDILKKKIESVESLARNEKLFNIETKRINLENEKALKKYFKNKKLNWVVLINVLSENDNKAKGKILKNSTEIMNKESKLLIIEWRKNQLKISPDIKMLVDPIKLENYLNTLKLTKRNDLITGIYHYGFIFEKKAKNKT